MATKKQIIDEATDKVVEYMYREEERHFRECLEEDDIKDVKMFMKKIKEHIFYSIAVMKYRGDIKAINTWLQEYWLENSEPESDDEESDDEEEN